MGLFKYEVVTVPLLFPHGTGSLVVMPEAGACAVCKQLARIFINRNGESKCAACDPGEPAVQTSAASRWYCGTCGARFSHAPQGIAEPARCACCHGEILEAPVK